MNSDTPTNNTRSVPSAANAVLDNGAPVQQGANRNGDVLVRHQLCVVGPGLRCVAGVVQNQFEFPAEAGSWKQEHLFEAQGHPPAARPWPLQDPLSVVSLRQNEEYLIDPTVGIVCMGLGWDTKVDIDGSAILFSSEFEVIDVVWFRHLKSKCGSVTHSGDNMTGEGSGDDEVIAVDLDKVPLNVHHIVFTVCVYSVNVSFNQVENAHVRLMHGKPKYKQPVMCNFTLTQMSGNAMLMGQMTRKGGYWNFRALGTPAIGRSVQEILQKLENLYCLRNSPSFAPIFRNISVRVVRGTNLTAKDAPGIFQRQGTSDPYYIISYKGKTFSSTHKNRTLDPVWTDAPFQLGAVMETERKAVKVSVFDYDLISADDFMGIVKIRASELFSLGVGQRTLSLALEPSKKKPFKDEDVSGEIHLIVTVEEIAGQPSNLHRA